MNEVVPNTSLELRTRLAKAIRDSYAFNKDYSASDRIILEKYKAVLNNLNGFIVLCNYTTGLYDCISDGVRSHLGYDLRNYSSEALTNFMLSIIHESSREFLLSSLLPTVFQYFKENSTVVTGTDYRYTCCLKVKNVYGEYRWYLIDTAIIAVDDNGFPLRTLITCTDIHQFKKDESIYYNILKKNEEGIYEVMLDGTDDNKKSDSKLTNREVEIINLISRGLTNKQIAYKLGISLFTVQTHRKSIMRKTKCNGTAELTNFAFSRGLL